MPRLSTDQPFLHPACEIKNSSFGSYVEIGKGSRLVNAQFEDYSYCDRYTDIANSHIGKFANIAAFSRIGATDHPLQTAACHHFVYRSDDYWDDTDKDHAFLAHRASRIAYVGNDTWIGASAMIKPGITLGHGAVVASSAVVTKDVDPYTIVAGTPAKPLRLRQPRKIADRLIALAWWDWSHEALRASLDDFRHLSAEAFLEKYES